MEKYVLEKMTSMEHSKDIIDRTLGSATVPELVDQMKTFLFAGHDTTAIIISWIFYFLAEHPDILLRVRKELDEVFGVNTTPSQVAEQIISAPKLHTKLKFTLACIKESLRLEPPASPVRQSTPGYSFTTSSNITFSPPEECLIYISTYLLHRDPNVWGEDADEFKPDRFMKKEYTLSSYMPFSRRPRDCIGNALALLEVVHVLCGSLTID